MSFKDHFSCHAADYAAYRPGYPPRLYQWLSTLPPCRNLAWDCACGNGQAAVGLADYFAAVIATDASRQQIEQAIPHAGVSYQVATAENSGLADHAVDLIAIAQAMHWLDQEPFLTEAKRVVKSVGILAVWSYSLLTLDNPALDAIVNQFDGEIVGPYWPPERRWVDDHYQTLELPLEEVRAPRFTMQACWDLAGMVAYLSTWSATRRYIDTHGVDPLPALEQRLTSVWGNPSQSRSVTWPLHLRVWRFG